MVGFLCETDADWLWVSCWPTTTDGKHRNARSDCKMLPPGTVSMDGECRQLDKWAYRARCACAVVGRFLRMQSLLRMSGQCRGGIAGVIAGEGVGVLGDDGVA